MSTYNRKIVVARGDTQSGHAGGLLNPEAIFPVVGIDEDGAKVILDYEEAHLNPVQRQLWKWSEDDRQKVQDLAEGDEIVFLEMGDMTQGARFTDDLQETSLSRQMIASYFNSWPWLAMPNVHIMRAVKGTGVHVWGEGSTETILTMLLQREFPDKDVRIASHYLLNVDGFSIDVAHHGPGPGIRHWTRGNVFELYAKSIMMHDVSRGRHPPNLLLRAHKHEFIFREPVYQVDGKIYEMTSVILPPYCFIGSHAEKVMNSPSSMGVGTVAFELINGKLLDTYPFTHFVDLRTEEVLHGNNGHGISGEPAADHGGGSGEDAPGGTAGDGLDGGEGNGGIRVDGEPVPQAPEPIDEPGDPAQDSLPES